MRGGRASVGPKDRHEPVVPGTHYAEEEWSLEVLTANPQLLNSVELETKLFFNSQFCVLNIVNFS